MKMQANDLRVGDVIRNTHGDHITVKEITRTDAGCLDVNPGQEGEMNGHAWEWVEVISRGPEPTPAVEEPAAPDDPTSVEITVTVHGIHPVDVEVLTAAVEDAAAPWKPVVTVTRDDPAGTATDPAPDNPAPCRCLPFQRYGCGHCPHTDCQNPDCGHCPCKCPCA